MFNLKFFFFYFDGKFPYKVGMKTVYESDATFFTSVLNSKNQSSSNVSTEHSPSSMLPYALALQFRIEYIKSAL